MATMTDEITMADYIGKHGITATARRADHNPNVDDTDWGAGARHWIVTLERGGKWMLVPFSQGSAWTTEPTAADVLESLASDASGYENAPSFDEWCAEYGYDTDSRKAERTFNLVREQSQELSTFLGDDAYEELLWNVREA